VRVLLDENLDWRLSRDLPGHEVNSVSRIGGAGIQNGELLRRAKNRYNVLVTMDGGMRSQQSISAFKIAIVALRARSNRLADTPPLMPELLRVLPLVRAGRVRIIPSM
jgi:predicted nuclease of predicted toxin-antitoxin system